ncbi:MAG: TetR/AcrR family transcriptional regulator [Spirochaetes bacterium]|nr:TetR/AcrR family transcriptional regulator [Spirochaetota bacterium]
MSPRTPQQFQEIREEKITLIMDVALECFASEGFYRTSISQIAKRAGISKGLLYNYFESKEALLKAIIDKSIIEIYRYLDINKDGYLSEDEFDFFIRKMHTLFKNKRSFWMLLIQLLVQNDVREQFLTSFPKSDPSSLPDYGSGNNYYPSLILKMFRDYFYSKKEKRVELYDPDGELEMFYITLVGYAMKIIYSENDNDEADEIAIKKIIELYK